MIENRYRVEIPKWEVSFLVTVRSNSPEESGTVVCTTGAHGRWSVGKPEHVLRTWVKSKGGTIVEMKSRSSLPALNGEHVVLVKSSEPESAPALSSWDRYVQTIR
jgi:hypothetical protein